MTLISWNVLCLWAGFVARDFDDVVGWAFIAFDAAVSLAIIRRAKRRWVKQGSERYEDFLKP